MSATLTIRAFHERDTEAVIALWRDVFPDEPERNESASLIRTKLTQQRDTFLVCEMDGRVVGTVMAGFDGVRGWVHKVAAHPDYRRQGVARQLMSAAEHALAAKGCRKLNLQVRAGNTSAVRFYQDAGYQIEDRVSMGKELSR